MGSWSRILCVVSVALALACDKGGEATEPPTATAPTGDEVGGQEEVPRESAGSATLHLALSANETAGFCCDQGTPDSGTGCRRDDKNLDACLQDGYYTFECSGRRVDCTDGTCECGEETGDGMMLCCTSVDGKAAHQCSKWSDSDYTACLDAGRAFTVCAGEKACKKSGGDDTRFDCNCQ